MNSKTNHCDTENVCTLSTNYFLTYVAFERFVKVVLYKSYRIHLYRKLLLLLLMGAWICNRRFSVLGHARKSYFCQSKMAEPKVLQFVLFSRGGQWELVHLSLISPSFLPPPLPQDVGIQSSEVQAKTITGLCCPASQPHTMTTSMSISVGWWSISVQQRLIAYYAV